MKKIILLLLSVVFITPAFAYPYKFNSDEMKFILSASANKTEKSVQKLMIKADSADKTTKKLKYYKKILEIDSSYMPAVYELTFLYANEGNAREVLKYATQLRNLNSGHILPDDMITDIIARSNLKLRRYYDAAREFEKITDINLAKRNYTILADTFLKLNEYKKTINYAAKVTPSDYNYYEAKELLYTANYKLNNFDNALKHAKDLINLNPSLAQNYIKAALVCNKNKTQKLDFLYRAKRILLSNPDEQIYLVDSMIAEIEQKEIDNAYKKLTDFVVKPDWKTVYINNSPDIDFYIQNWSKRQDEFYKTANNCIVKYSGTNLVKCFEALNLSEEKKSNDVKEQIRAIQEQQKKREQELMMQRLLYLQQRMMYYNRYNYYPYRYYRPYYYW